MTNLSLLITCPKGLEGVLQSEIESLGATETKQTVGGVYCRASLEVMYTLCLWSRLANRVLLSLAAGPVKNSDDCYDLCREIAWHQILAPHASLAVQFVSHSEFMRNTLYGAQLIKDAIVDQLRESQGSRCNIDPENPDCRVQARLHHGQLSLYYDLSGHSLHQRGYRRKAGEAPIKENLAAGLLIRANWPTLAKEHKPLIDPCCGSGTLLIEAAMIATDKAPGLDQYPYGFSYWQNHDEKLWQSVRMLAQERHEVGLENSKSIFYGFDQSSQVIAIAKQNAKAAGLDERIQFECRNVSAFEMPVVEKTGLLITNPPYGERLTESAEWISLYQDLGAIFANHLQRWQAAVFTSDPLLAKSIGMRSHKQYAFLNGTIPCQLYLFDLNETNKSNLSSLTSHSEMIFNRLKKNRRNLDNWIKQNNIQAYRLYDADIPEYAFAIDIYNDWAHVQEYKAPQDIPLEKTQQRLLDVLQALPKAIGIPREKIVVKERKKQKGIQQYEKQAETQHRITVFEGPAEFYVNCQDYLDTGLFLDHRLLRREFLKQAKGKTFLNLFCYTATASIMAAIGGAKKTTNVDMSRTYLDWAKDNFRLNKQTLREQDFLQENCLEWLAQCRDKFDIIFLDPPSFSNSKRMEGVLDIQRDHANLIKQAMSLLNPKGSLYFSTNFRKFRLDESLSKQFTVQDITTKTIDKDYSRNAKIHQCFLIQA